MLGLMLGLGFMVVVDILRIVFLRVVVGFVVRAFVGLVMMSERRFMFEVR